MVSATLDEGAGDLDSQAFQGKLEDLSISLGFDAGRDSFGGDLRTLTRNLETAFDLLRLALTRPRFDTEAVERMRARIQAGLRRASENPRRIANRTLMRALFPNHAYGRPTNGRMDSVARIKIADLKLFAARRLARDNLIVSVVGDIEPKRLAGLLDASFGALPAKAAPWKLPEVEATAKGRTILVEKKVPQSVIRFGQPGIKRDDPDFYAAYVMNYVLGGGGFASRLYSEVREKRGLAYSAFSYLSALDHGGLIYGGAATANARAGETVKVLGDEWRRMAVDGMSTRELKDAKTYLTGSYALRFSSSGRIAGMLTSIQMDKLGIEYMDRRNSLIEAVTLADVNRVARRLLAPDGLTMVVVGAPVGVNPRH
jgi:zinc protease